MAKKASKDKNSKVKAKAKPVVAKVTKVAKKAVPAKKATEKPAKVAKQSAVKEKPVVAPKVKKSEPSKVVKANKDSKPVVKEVKKEVRATKAVKVIDETPVKEVKSKVNKSSLLKVVEDKAETSVSEVKKTEPTKKSKAKLEVDQNAKWADLFEKYKAVKPVIYNMREVFEANQPMQHKVLGWGWIMSNENDRLEVLFKDGKKILISNYKG